MIRRLVVVLAMFPMVARAVDVSAGAVEVSGFSNLQFSSYSMKTSSGSSTDVTSYGVNAGSLYYVTPYFGLGVTTGYTHTRVEFESATASSWSVLAGPAVGFLYPLDEKFSFAVHGDVFFSRSNSSGDPLFGERTTKGFGFGLGAGVKYFLARSFSIDVLVQYTYSKATESGGPSLDATSSGLGVGAGLSVYFGN